MAAVGFHTADGGEWDLGRWGGDEPCAARHEWQKEVYGKACNMVYDNDVVVVV